MTTLPKTDELSRPWKSMGLKRWHFRRCSGAFAVSFREVVLPYEYITTNTFKGVPNGS